MSYSPYQSSSSSASPRRPNNLQQQYRQQQAMARRRTMMRQAMNQQRLRGQNQGMKIQQQRMQRARTFGSSQQQPRKQSQPQQQPNVLFYSDRCPHSKKFITALKKNPKIFNNFVHVSVDRRGVKIPSCIKKVPTIVVYDSSNRRQILTDYRAFEWLNHVIDAPVEIGCFQPGHMGTRLSDDYSLLDGSETNEHSFAFLDDLNKHYIYTPKNTDSERAYDQTEINFNRLEELRRSDPIATMTQGRLPPGHEPDFTKSTIAEIDTVKSSDFDRALESRKRQTRQMRGPTPMHAPNFTSGQFRSEGFQSNRGGYVPAGEDVLDSRSNAISMSDYKKLVSMRERDQQRRRRQQQQQQPSQQRSMDWSMNLKPMKVL
jgi:hypothetical protein